MNPYYAMAYLSMLAMLFFFNPPKQETTTLRPHTNPTIGLSKVVDRHVLDEGDVDAMEPVKGVSYKDKISPKDQTDIRQVDLRVMVLTYKRAESLQRLLESIRDAKYETSDVVAVDVWIDIAADATSVDAATLKVSSEFCALWTRGPCVVHERETNAGLRKQWLEAWDLSVEGGLKADTKEIGVILEDDLAVSRFYWKYLKGAWGKYRSYEEIAGITLQRLTLCSHGCGNSLPGGAKGADDVLFFSMLLGTWGYSPKPEMWVPFTQWADAFIKSGDKPYVTGASTLTGWYKQFEKEGRCPGVRCMWSILHMYYVERHKARYTLYVNDREKHTMASNFREAGLHYGKSNQGADFPLISRWNTLYEDYPDRPIRVGWDGKVNGFGTQDVDLM